MRSQEIVKVRVGMVNLQKKGVVTFLGVQQPPRVNQTKEMKIGLQTLKAGVGEMG